jgi:hypothetical protein
MKQAAAAARQARLTRVLGIARVPAQTLVPIASDSNDVWRIGAVVLRICWRGDRDRFARAAALTAALPPGIPYPEIVDAGHNDELAWQVTRAVDGVPLAAAWPGKPVVAEERDHQLTVVRIVVHFQDGGRGSDPARPASGGQRARSQPGLRHCDSPRAATGSGTCCRGTSGGPLLRAAFRALRSPALVKGLLTTVTPGSSKPCAFMIVAA